MTKNEINKIEINKKIESINERFWSKVDKRNEDECWDWNACINSVGRYGNFNYNKKCVSAHRISYILTFGEIPEGKHVLHRCDNGLCVNPKHLFLGTHLDNMKDKAIKNRVYRPIGEENLNHVLTWKLINEIRETYKNNIRITLHELSKKYDMYETLLSKIVNNKIWKDVNYEVPFHINGKSGEGNGRSKLTWKQIYEIREKCKNESINKLSKDYNVCWLSVKNIIKNKTWII